MANATLDAIHDNFKGLLAGLVIGGAAVWFFMPQKERVVTRTGPIVYVPQPAAPTTTAAVPAPQPLVPSQQAKRLPGDNRCRDGYVWGNDTLGYICDKPQQQTQTCKDPEMKWDPEIQMCSKVISPTPLLNSFARNSACESGWQQNQRRGSVCMNCPDASLRFDPDLKACRPR